MKEAEIYRFNLKSFKFQRYQMKDKTRKEAELKYIYKLDRIFTHFERYVVVLYCKLIYDCAIMMINFSYIMEVSFTLFHTIPDQYFFVLFYFLHISEI